MLMANQLDTARALGNDLDTKLKTRVRKIVNAISGTELARTGSIDWNGKKAAAPLYGSHDARIKLEVMLKDKTQWETTASRSGFHTINVRSLPVANAGEDQIILLDPVTNSVEVSFNGSGSTAPDGIGAAPVITNYAWDFSAPDPADSGTPSSVTGAKPAATTTYYTLGVKTVTLTVTDNDDPALDDQDTVEVKVVKLTPVFTPKDNFAGRSLSRFAIAEEIDLNFTVEPPSITAAEIGGLEWEQLSGNGVLETDSNNEGVAEFRAATTPGSVTLKLSVVNGPMAGQGPTRTIEVILPSGVRFIQAPGTGIAHVQNIFSVGLFATPYLLPRDASFDHLLIREESIKAEADGYFLQDKGKLHEMGRWHGVGPGNITDGCRVNLRDSVAILSNNTPHTEGNFRWLIPWAVGIKQLDPPAIVKIAEFAVVLQHAYAVEDEPGTAYILKGSLGPFKADLDDPTTSPPGWSWVPD